MFRRWISVLTFPRFKRTLIFNGQLNKKIRTFSLSSSEKIHSTHIAKTAELQHNVRTQREKIECLKNRYLKISKKYKKGKASLFTKTNGSKENGDQSLKYEQAPLLVIGLVIRPYGSAYSIVDFTTEKTLKIGFTNFGDFPTLRARVVQIVNTVNHAVQELSTENENTATVALWIGLQEIQRKYKPNTKQFEKQTELLKCFGAVESELAKTFFDSHVEAFPKQDVKKFFEKKTGQNTKAPADLIKTVNALVPTFEEKTQETPCEFVTLMAEALAAGLYTRRLSKIAVYRKNPKIMELFQTYIKTNRNVTRLANSVVSTNDEHAASNLKQVLDDRVEFELQNWLIRYLDRQERSLRGCT